MSTESREAKKAAQASGDEGGRDTQLKPEHKSGTSQEWPSLPSQQHSQSQHGPSTSSSRPHATRDTNPIRHGRPMDPPPDVPPSEGLIPPDSRLPTLEEIQTQERQVIAVSASKGPAAFFNLARKFLATDEMCDLSALEGAIVAAVDAAHLLERSKLATIVRVQTSFVTVEPKRKKTGAEPAAKTGSYRGSRGIEGSVSSSATASASSGHSAGLHYSVAGTGTHGAPHIPAATSELHSPGRGETGELVESRRQSGRSRGSGGREVRRARIIITVKRTDGYKQWLAENPLQAIIAGDVDAADDPTIPSETQP